ncbi:MAG: DNA recombination protein RmuC, partial [Verrucomicrobia bacterium]|nr:DNA recombination protein RmuC [Verrucomicrobiota bacterium]
MLYICSFLFCALFAVTLFLAIRHAGLVATLKERSQRAASLEEQLFLYEAEKNKLCSKVAELSARLEEEKRLANEKMALLVQDQEKLTAAFKAISSDAIRESQRSFFDAAKLTFEKYVGSMQQKELAVQDIVKPLYESLQKVDGKIHELEKIRQSAYVGITEQLKSLASTQMHLQNETSKLVKALHVPSVRGKWGELQLKRVVEMAGMVAYCDFFEQQQMTNHESRIRPDLVVRLPNSRSIIVDAKTPLQAYLEATEASSEEARAQKMKEHARHLKSHLASLGEKAYWEHFQPTPEFVILFLPAESFFSAALEFDHSLIEYGVERKVLLATPTTLIALLRAVAYGWKEVTVAEHAQAICEQGKTLYDRLSTMADHFVRLKKSLSGSVEAYNKTVASFESRVLPAARRFQEMGAADSVEIPFLDS